jgi:hypothetical protein
MRAVAGYDLIDAGDLNGDGWNFLREVQRGSF